MEDRRRVERGLRDSVWSARQDRDKEQVGAVYIIQSCAMSGLETVWLLCCVVTLSSSLVGHREDPGEDEGVVWLGRGE